MEPLKSAFLVFVSLIITTLAYATPNNPFYKKSASEIRLERAKVRFEKGKKFYEENDFQAALVEFKRAYELVHNYSLLFNIGQIYYQIQDYPEALHSFQKYLSEGSDKIPHSRVAEIKREISNLRMRIAHLDISTNKAGASIFIDDVLIGKTPLPGYVDVSSGRRKVTAVISGCLPSTKIVEVGGGDMLRVGIELLPISPPANPATVRPGTSHRRRIVSNDHQPSWLYWAIPAGLAATGVGLGIAALQNSQDLQTARDRMTKSYAQRASLSRDTKQIALAADICGGLAIISAGILGYLSFYDNQSSNNGTASLQLTGGPQGMSVSGSF